MDDLDVNSRRIVVYRHGGIGDVIHTLPLVKYLRKIYSTASIEYVTSKDTAELLSSCCPYIDKVWIFDKKNKNRFFKSLLGTKSKIDYFINLHTNLRLFFYNLFFIRARRFFQYRKDNSLHAVVNFAKTYDPNLSAFSLDSKLLYIKENNNILKRFDLKEGRYICFVPGVGKIRPHRGWPFENWLGLTKKYLNHQKEFKVVYLGGEYEKNMIESWVNLARGINAYKDEHDSQSLPGFKGRAIDLTGRLSLFESAEIVSGASHLVSCDTGLLHLAAAIGTRVVGLFGPTSSKRSGPFTGNCQVLEAKNCRCINPFIDVKSCKKTSEKTGFCMNSLLVDEVLTNLVNLECSMGGSSASSRRAQGSQLL